MVHSMLKCIFLHYHDVNFGNESWGKGILKSENHLNALHKGGNERDGWMSFVINSYYENLVRLIYADCLIKT